MSKTSGESINSRAAEIGKALFDSIHRKIPSVTSLNKWTQEIIEWCLSHPDIKGRLLRFVDVLPSLTTDKAIIDHIRDYFPVSESRLPLALRGGSLLSRAPFTSRTDPGCIGRGGHKR
jgi:RHH-type proline utilization regulon transcriptional repressor/proline dehydrogenase/delta 1-pyrroline-5-carboxylate dehydrogenase